LIIIKISFIIKYGVERMAKKSANASLHKAKVEKKMNFTRSLAI